MSQSGNSMGNSTGSNSSAGMNSSSNAGSGTSSAAGSGASATGMDNVMNRVRETTEQAREMLNEKMGAVGEQLSGMTGSLGEQLSGVTGSLSDGVDRIRHMDREDYEQAWTSVQDRARQNPGQTILISAAVGFLLGMMMRSGGRR